ncbi:MAG TPA: glycoside hydrolase family 3 N-terminal domain-containing protein [Gemmatimonadales bacterium]|nr:glycoside hydrolase family 3 N-terminal domain-containing protein [Gemmatimonadales bacterium]
MHLRSILLSLALGASVAHAGRGQAGAPYHDARLPVAERVRDLLGRMTLEEKFWQLYMTPGDLSDSTRDYSHGAFGLQVPAVALRGTPADLARADAQHIDSIQRWFVERTRLGIPIVPFDEAVHGLVRPGATVFPQAVALAATWDTAVVGHVAAAIASETATRGIHQVLSPVLNLSRDVRWGRVEETYGEDPLLAATMGRAFIAPFEAAGIAATPKHFIANVGEGGRDSYPIEWDERELEETYFPPFAAAIQDARAHSIMTAYNSVNGSPATQNRWLLSEVLKRRWGFAGFVISDAAATGGATVLHMTEPDTPAAARDAFAAGLDVVFQSSYEQYRPYWDAVRRGLVPDSVIDRAVARVLRAKFELGLFDHPYADPDSAARAARDATHQALALAAAREAIVLLKNAGPVLPIRSGRTIALIGPDAAEARLGGYSAPGERRISILAGLRAAVSSRGVVRYEPGPGRGSIEYLPVPAGALAHDSSGVRRPGVHAAYYDNITLAGAAQFERIDPRIDFAWTLEGPGPGIARDWYSVRWTGRLAVPATGVRHIGVVGSDGFRLYLDGRLVLDDWEKRSAGARLAAVTLQPGRSYELRLEYFETTGNGRVRLVWDAGVSDDWRSAIGRATRLARTSDVAVIVAGIEEGEFRDRASLRLPGHQDELIRDVAATGTPCVVVLVGGSAITMSGWLDRVAAVLDVWYPGEAGGRAVAEVLLGTSNPGGRLPITFPVSEGQLPLVYDHKPTGRGDDYVDLTGLPLFPFGYGLSYTSFAYSGLTVEPAEIPTAGRATVRCRVQNVGSRAGDEVVQLYVKDELASVTRPVLQLAGFQRIRLAPGEEREVSFVVGPDALRMLDRELKWVVEPGVFRVLVGASSRDLRLRGSLTVR